MPIFVRFQAAAAAAAAPVTSPTDEGLCAVALYDYQAAAEDEISFDPNDTITNIEMVSKTESIVGTLSCPQKRVLTEKGVLLHCELKFGVEWDFSVCN